MSVQMYAYEDENHTRYKVSGAAYEWGRSCRKCLLFLYPVGLAT